MKILLFFHAPWCPPCHFYDRTIISPLEQIIGCERIIRVNVQNEPAMAEKYGVEKLPTIVVLNGDKRILQSTGGYTVEQLVEIMRKGGEISD